MLARPKLCPSLRFTQPSHPPTQSWKFSLIVQHVHMAWRSKVIIIIKSMLIMYIQYPWMSMPDYFCHPLSCAQQVPQLEGNIIEESQAGFWYWCWSCCSWSTKYRRSLELSIWSFRSPRLVFGAGAEAAATGQQQYRRSLELRISSFRRRGEWFLREKKTGPWQCCANCYWTPIPKFHFDNFARFEDLKKQVGRLWANVSDLLLSLF